MTNNPSFLKFLDEKFIPLSLRTKAAICLSVVLVLSLLFYFMSYRPYKQQIVTLQQDIQHFENTLKITRQTAENLDTLKKSTSETEKNFQILSALLPDEKEIPQLLKDISALGHSAGLDFDTFKPEQEIHQDFFKKIPVTIKVRGSYHNLGYFFDQISKLARIVSVTNVRMSSPETKTDEILLQSDCRLLTYQFLSEPPQKPAEKNHENF